MTVSIGDIIKTVVSFTMQDGIIAQNVFYHELDGLSPVAESTIITQLISTINTLYALVEDQIVGAVTLDDFVCNKWEYDVVDGWRTGPYIGFGTLTDAFAGPGDGFPHAVAATITGFTQDVRTRSRKSLPGFREAAAADSSLTALALADLVSFAAFWTVPWAVDTNEDLYPGVPAKDGTFKRLTGSLISGYMGSQRQRKPGIGI